MTKCYKCDMCNGHNDYNLNVVEIKDSIIIIPRKKPVFMTLRGYERSSVWDDTTRKRLRDNSKRLELCDSCFKKLKNEIVYDFRIDIRSGI